MEIVWGLGVLVAVFIGLPYFIGPIRVWWNLKMPASYKFNLLEPTRFLSERNNTFLNLHQEVINSGFDFVGSSIFDNKQSSLCFSLYYSDDLKLCCTVSSNKSKSYGLNRCEFTQLFADGTVVNINNSGVMPVYPGWDKKIIYRFPQVNDVNELLEVALQLIDKHDGLKIGLEKGREFETLENFFTKELSRLVSLGWVSKKIKGGERRLTFKGAVLMTWKLCWPIKNILNRMNLKQSKMALEKV